MQSKKRRLRQSWFLLCIWLTLPTFLLKLPKATTRSKKPKRYELLHSSLSVLTTAPYLFKYPIVKLSIPGISTLAAWMILGEIVDIHRFSQPHKLLAFAGLGPSVKQSGNFCASHTRMSKHGSRYLRYALMYAAYNAVKNSDTFKQLYNKKTCKQPGASQCSRPLCSQAGTNYPQNAYSRCIIQLVISQYYIFENSP